MEIVEFCNEGIKNLIKQNLKSRTLVPIIGSGFTQNSKANKGVVPNGADMKSFMINSLLNSNLQVDRSEVENQRFPEVARLYEKHVKINQKHKYLQDNFTEVKLNDLKRRFLKIEWPYIYTLNIDDGIENNSDYRTILPRTELNPEISEKYKCLFKLHGDVHDVLKYKNSDKYIFTESQYIKSLKDNQYLLELLQTDIISNNIIYLGCSLEDEIDILSKILDVSLDSLDFKKETYFITNEKPNELKQSKLEDLGITKIVLIQDYIEFYTEFINISNEAKSIEEGCFNDFLNLEVIQENKEHGINFPYLLFTNKPLDKFDEKKIKIPYYFIERDITRNIIEDLYTTTIQLIYGHRVSGKTYCLIDVLMKIKNRDTYFFPSTVSIGESGLEKILDIKNAVILFDSNSIDYFQINYLIKKISMLKKNKVNIVITTNTSEREILNLFTVHNEEDIKKKKLMNKFSEGEANEVNEKILFVSLPIFNQKKTLLDNIFNMEELLQDSLGGTCYSIKERPKILSLKELITFIVLATKESITTFDMSHLGLISDIGGINTKYEPVIQFEYTRLLERVNHSGNKVIANAKYWILKTLGDYGRIKANQEAIGQAYKIIVNSYKKLYKNPKEFNKKVSPYIKFDTINDVFPREEQGSALLINKIYEKLSDVLSDNPHYLHQRSKSKWILFSNNELELKEALRYVKTAIHNIEIMYENGNYKSNYIVESVSHMKFTEALIYGRLTNITRYRDKELVKSAVNSYYTALLDPENKIYISNLLKKTYKNRHKDTADLIKLRDVVMFNEDFDSSRDQISEIFYGRIG